MVNKTASALVLSAALFIYTFGCRTSGSAPKEVGGLPTASPSKGMDSDPDEDSPEQGQGTRVRTNSLQPAPIHDIDRARARSFIDFWNFDDTPSSALISERIEEEEDGSAKISLSYLSRLDGKQLSISLDGDSSAYLFTLPKEGSVTLAQQDGPVWEAVGGTVRVELIDGGRILHLEGVVLEQEGAGANEPLTGSVRGQLRRQCFVLPLTPKVPRAQSATGASGSLVATRFDPKWQTPFCAQHR